jgi:hypothetical protein
LDEEPEPQFKSLFELLSHLLSNEVERAGKISSLTSTTVVNLIGTSPQTEPGQASDSGSEYENQSWVSSMDQLIKELGRHLSKIEHEVSRL